MKGLRDSPVPPGSNQPDIVILGAGMSGLCMAIQLLRSGVRSFTILEKSGYLGGTWWDNTYPGAQCDVRSHLYSFSFAANPDWSRVFASQREILAYMTSLAERWSLHAHLCFATELVAANFDAERKRWRLRTRTGELLDTRVLVCSTGPLSEPHWPDIPGLREFGGALMHTARWNHDFAFDGKTVAVIGSAASAVQVVPRIAQQVRQLHVFQRTANWIVPRPDRAYRSWERSLSSMPPIGRLRRWLHYWLQERNRLGFDQGSTMARLFAGLARHHLRKHVSDPQLIDKLQPNYPIGCKRILLSNDYYRALVRPNVELVTAPIARVEPDALVTTDGGRRTLDAIVCATGFETLRLLGSVDVRGMHGQRLGDAWRDAPRAFHGVTVAGFPNLFLLLGPNSGSGHTSVLLYVEAQVKYVLRALRELERRGKSWLAVKPTAMQEHNLALQARLSETVWAAPCSSWYKNASGHNAAIYPGYSFQYTRSLRKLGFDEYEFG